MPRYGRQFNAQFANEVNERRRTSPGRHLTQAFRSRNKREWIDKTPAAARISMMSAAIWDRLMGQESMPRREMIWT